MGVKSDIERVLEVSGSVDMVISTDGFRQSRLYDRFGGISFVCKHEFYADVHCDLDADKEFFEAPFIVFAGYETVKKRQGLLPALPLERIVEVEGYSLFPVISISPKQSPTLTGIMPGSSPAGTIALIFRAVLFFVKRNFLPAERAQINLAEDIKAFAAANLQHNFFRLCQACLIVFLCV